MRIEASGLIYDARDRPPCGRIAFFPTLCVLRNGSILAACQCGSAKHANDSTLRLCRSDDGGRVWTEIPSPFPTRFDDVMGSLSGPALVEAEPGRLRLFATWFDRSDPNRPLFDPVTEGILRSKLLTCSSTDEGETWSGWAELPTPGLTGVATTGPILQWASGLIAFAFESFKEFDDPRPGRHAAWLMALRDGGRTFGQPLLVAQHPEHKRYYWDQRLCTGRADGEIIALFWTHDLVLKKDLCVHFLCTVMGENRLRSEMPRETTIHGQIAAPLLLADGRLLAFVVDRERPATMSLWSSADGGNTWPAQDRLVVYSHEERAVLSQSRENVDFKQYWEDMGKWSFGHPVIVPLHGECVLLAWYAGTPDRMSVHWARVHVAQEAKRIP